MLRQPFTVHDRTLSFWVRVQPGKDGTALAAFLDEHENWSMLLKLSSSGNPTLDLFNSALSKSSSVFDSSTKLSGKRWVHFAVVLDAGKKQTSLVVNGKVVRTMKFLPDGRSYFLHLGRTKHAATTKALFHEISLHHRVLTAAELARLASPARPLRAEAGRLLNPAAKKSAPAKVARLAPYKTQKEILYPTASLRPYQNKALHKSLQFLLHCDHKEWKYLFTRFLVRRVKPVASRWHGKACAFNGRNTYLRTDQNLSLNNATLQFWFRPRKKKGGLFSIQHPMTSSLVKGKTPRLAWGWQVGIQEGGQIEVNAFDSRSNKAHSLKSRRVVSVGLWNHLALSVSKTFQVGKKSKIRVKLYLNGRLQNTSVWPLIQHQGQGFFGGSPHFRYFDGELDDLAFFVKEVPESAIRWYASARSPLTTLVDPKAEERRNAAEEQKLSPAEFAAYKGAAIDTLKRGLALSRKAARQSSASLWKIAQEMLQTSQQMLTVILRKGGKLPKGLDFRRPIDLPPAPITRAAPPAR